MPGNEKRGITVKVDAGLHAEIRSYLEAHDMTMGEFISLAAENTLHPKFQVKESTDMTNARTLAFQVPEELFQRIKDYLRRNGMTQKQFVIGLIEDELERDEALHQNAENGAQEPTDEGEEAEEDPDPVDEPAEDVDGSEGVSGEEAEEELTPPRISSTAAMTVKIWPMESPRTSGKPCEGRSSSVRSSALISMGEPVREDAAFRRSALKGLSLGIRNFFSRISSAEAKAQHSVV